VHQLSEQSPAAWDAAGKLRGLAHGLQHGPCPAPAAHDSPSEPNSIFIGSLQGKEKRTHLDKFVIVFLLIWQVKKREASHSCCGDGRSCKSNNVLIPPNTASQRFNTDDHIIVPSLVCCSSLRATARGAMYTGVRCSMMQTHAARRAWRIPSRKNCLVSPCCHDCCCPVTGREPSRTRKHHVVLFERFEDRG